MVLKLIPKVFSSQIVNWRWKRPEKITPESQLPLLVQFDGGDHSETKFQALNRLGAAFVDENSLSSKAEKAVCVKKTVVNGILAEKRFLESSKKTEKANFVIRFFHHLFELVNYIPGIQTLLLSVIFPYYAYYLLI